MKLKFARPLIACCIATAMLAAPTTVVLAAAPMVKTQAPAYYRIMLGDFEITALSDGTVALPVDKLLQDTTQKAIHKALAAHYQHSPLNTSVNAFLINTGDKLVLIDSGAGTLFGSSLGKLLINLKASGYTPEQVDEIYITHMHPDHVGGLADDGQRVFPNAVVRADQADADYWLNPDNMAKAPEEAKAHFAGAMASLKPYIDAGQFKPFNGDTELMPGIRAIVTHGHTPGHTVYEVESKGLHMRVLGDLIHVAAVQFDHPKVAIAFDTDSKTAVQARLKVFDEIAKNGEIAAGAHLAFPGLGHIRKQGKGYEWIPLNYQSNPLTAR